MARAHLVFLLLAGVLLGNARSAHADRDRPRLREKVHERVRAIRVARLVEALELDEATAARVFPILNEYDRRVMTATRDAGQAMREMHQVLRSGRADDARLNALIDRIIARRKEIERLELERFQKLRSVLSPEQTAKLILVHRHIDREIRKHIKKALRDHDDERP